METFLIDYLAKKFNPDNTGFSIVNNHLENANMWKNEAKRKTSERDALIQFENAREDLDFALQLKFALEFKGLRPQSDEQEEYARLIKEFFEE